MMDTQDLDAALTEWGSQARAAAGHQVIPELAVHPRRPRHFGWQLTAGAVAVVVAAALAVGIPRLLAKDGSAADPLRGITSTASAPAGFQVVTFHGLSITVPASWHVGVGVVCQPTRSLVELPGATLDCGRLGHQDLTVVDIGEGVASLPSMRVTGTSHTTISGLPAVRVEGVRNGGDFPGRAAFGYLLPALDASVQIMPATDQVGRELEASLRVDAVDSHGCAARTTERAIPSPSGVGRPGTADALVPGQPTTMSACRYEEGWLEQGNTVSGAALRAFASAVNGLPPGLSRTAESGVFQCPGGPGVSDGTPPPTDDIYRLELHYPDGPPVRLTARAGWCGDLGISNGSRTGQLTEALVRLLLDTAGGTGFYPSKVLPVR